MFAQANYSDSYDREKLRILQSLNTQVQTMVVKLDQIVTQAEENIFRVKSTPTNTSNRTTLANLNGSIEKPSEKLNSTFSNSQQEFKLGGGNMHHIIKIEDPSSNTNNNNQNSQIQKKPTRKRPRSIANMSKGSPHYSSQFNQVEESKSRSSVLNKRNKQQRVFNTFVRESINQLLGSDYMRTHDVQDIDAQVMEMIRKEAVENYLPENIRPRRAWHLAKASLRTLKRTLNNKKA